MSIYRRKDLLGLRDIEREEIEAILSTAVPMKDIITRDVKKVPTLKGKSVITLFYENSTRTSTSFDLAGRYLSADTPNLAVSTSSVQKGESLKDTIKTIEMMGFDVLVMRHPLSGAPHYVARNTSMHVINAGDGKMSIYPGALDILASSSAKAGTPESRYSAISCTAG